MRQSPEAMKVWIGARESYHDAVTVLSAHEAAASVIEAALQKARDEERAAVVAWLRENPMNGDYDFGPGMEVSADAIERNEHRREG